jgi:hypothetical protein
MMMMMMKVITNKLVKISNGTELIEHSSALTLLDF